MNQGNHENHAQKNELAIVSFFCGLIGLFGFWIPFICYIAFASSIIGIILGIIGIKKSKISGTGFNYAITGLICGILGTLIGIMNILFICFAFSFFRDVFRAIFGGIIENI